MGSGRQHVGVGNASAPQPIPRVYDGENSIVGEASTLHGDYDYDVDYDTDTTPTTTCQLYTLCALSMATMTRATWDDAGVR